MGYVFVLFMVWCSVVIIGLTALYQIMGLLFKWLNDIIERRNEESRTN